MHCCPTLLQACCKFGQLWYSGQLSNGSLRMQYDPSPNLILWQLLLSNVATSYTGLHQYSMLAWQVPTVSRPSRLHASVRATAEKKLNGFLHFSWMIQGKLEPTKHFSANYTWRSDAMVRMGWYDTLLSLKIRGPEHHLLQPPSGQVWSRQTSIWKPVHR